MHTIYEDSCISVDDEGITIFNYYFPLGQPKRILWNQVRSVQEKPLTALNGRLRMWGMGFRLYWLNNDFRINKDRMLVIDVGRIIKPAITPDNFELTKFAIEKKLGSKIN